MKKRNLPACKRFAAEQGHPDMFRGGYEATAMHKTKLVAAYYRKHHRYPPSSGDNAHELGKWLSYMRRCRRGKGLGVWYPACDELASELGCKDMFYPTDKEAKALENTRAVCEHIHETGAPPPTNGSNYLGHWLVHMRAAKANRRTGTVWYPACQTLAEELGCPDLFNMTDPKVQALQNTRDAISYRIEHGKWPPGTNVGGYIGRWLSHMRQSKLGKNKGIWYPECEELATELGYPTMFDPIGREVRALERTRELANYYDQHGTKINDKDARPLANWVSKMRMAKAGKAIKTVWYPSCEALAIELGHPHMFDQKL